MFSVSKHSASKTSIVESQLPHNVLSLKLIKPSFLFSACPSLQHLPDSKFPSLILPSMMNDFVLPVTQDSQVGDSFQYKTKQSYSSIPVSEIKTPASQTQSSLKSESIPPEKKRKLHKKRARKIRKVMLAVKNYWQVGQYLTKVPQIFKKFFYHKLRNVVTPSSLIRVEKSLFGKIIEKPPRSDLAS